MNTTIFKTPTFITVAVAAIMMGVTFSVATAGTADKASRKSNSSDEVQRTPTGVYDQQRNVVSNIDFYTSNYGIFAHDIRNGVGGAFWPRGKGNQYLFAGGVWFGALKRPPGIPELRKLVMITYNPNSGLSWMIPGSLTDGIELDNSAVGTGKYRNYVSTDFNRVDGVDFFNTTFPKWPIWDSRPNDTLRFGNYYGDYINDPENRTRSTYSKGPAFISEEDIFSVYKDTDLSRYEGGVERRTAQGFPLGFQIEQMIYSWGFGDYADMVFLKYLFIHPEKIGKEKTDTLYQCWMASVQDVDITLRTNPVGGAGNDRARYYSEEDTLNLAVQWTNGDRGETGNGFGYLGFNFLESPAVDADGFIRKDRKQYPTTEQLGLRTMRNWPITVDPLENEDRYNFMSTGQRDGDEGPGDRRLLMATGPFNMLPGDSARIVVGIVLGSTSTGKDATGTTEDMAELVRKVRFAQFVYNNNFRAPLAPDFPVVKGIPSDNFLYQVPAQGWLPLNNALIVQWDSTAEISLDTLENGLDFLGYRIYRARRTDLDSFNIDEIENQRLGPLGWKQVGQFQVPSPFLKSGTQIPGLNLFIDNFEIGDKIDSGQRRFLVRRSPTIQAPWGAYFIGLLQDRTRNTPNYAVIPSTNIHIDVNRFDKFDSIQYTYLVTQFEDLPSVNWTTSNGFRVPDPAQAKAAKDSLIKLIIARKVKMEPFKFAELVDSSNPVSKVIRRPFEESAIVRYHLIPSYMKRITNNRTFYDDGDDDKNGQVLYSSDVRKTEKLINNVEYSYAIRSFDEGDYLLPTAPKLCSRAVGLPNVVTATPLASRPGDVAKIEFSTNPDNGGKIGGIYNLKLLIKDQQRFHQLFAGRTLQLQFDRLWSGYDHDRVPANDDDGLYGVVMTLRDSATQQLITTWNSLLPPELCSSPRDNLPGYFSENSCTWLDSCLVRFDTATSNSGEIRIDTIVFALPDNDDRILRMGAFNSDAQCLANKYALSTVGISFDYAIQQWGGIYRAARNGEIVRGGDPLIYVGVSRMDALRYNATRPLNQPPSYFEIPYPGYTLNSPWDVSYNNGPGVYEIEFVEGGVEPSLKTPFKLDAGVGDDITSNPVKTFENVPYLKMKFRNVAEFEYPYVKSDGSTEQRTVGYPVDLNFVNVRLDSTAQLREFPNPELVPTGSYALAAYGWRNSQNGNTKGIHVQYHAADSNNSNPIAQGRYYRSRNISTEGKDTLDFMHVVSIAGAQFVIDFSGRGKRSASYSAVPGDLPADNGLRPKTDFQVGDKIRLFTHGGALGFPSDGAKMFAKVGQYDPSISGAKYTDENLEQIQVVPNPYYISHEGIRSSYESKLYLTRLPQLCKISFYTISGELIKEFTHDESRSTEPGKFGTDVWNLMSKNGQRVASQMMVVKIETPDGASVIRKFSVIVGPARIIGDSN
ncbi:MAG: hypothetical protein HQ472_06565 [Ignavibacteria bacterium]|nr:hypothetical protein [Ignavibacteria bacterium]